MEDGNRRILVADDDPGWRDLLRYRLERSGFAVAVAKDGSEALELSAQLDPSLLVLDIMLPEVDGYEVLRRLKADPSTRDMPVIIMTARTLEDDVVKGFELGAVDFVSKPFSPCELVARIRKTLYTPGH